MTATPLDPPGAAPTRTRLEQLIARGRRGRIIVAGAPNATTCRRITRPRTITGPVLVLLDEVAPLFATTDRNQ